MLLYKMKITQLKNICNLTCFCFNTYTQLTYTINVEIILVETTILKY